ncbi:MAG: hypothetical protein WCP21_04165, partial [Armatimonadota bacterium]
TPEQDQAWVDAFTYAVEAYNFDTTKAVEGTLALTLPTGWKCEPKEVAVSLPPMGRAVARFTLTSAGTSPEALSVVATAHFGNIPVVPSISHFRLDFTQIPPTETLDLKFNDPAKWTSNISDNGTMQLTVAEGGGVRTEATFTQPGDRWCYPFLRLEPPLDFSKFQGVAFDYRCGAAGDHVTARLQLYEPGGASYLPGALTCAKEWTRAVVRFEDLQWGAFSPVDANAKFDPQAISRLMVGLNTSEDKAWLEVRNLQLVKW